MNCTSVERIWHIYDSQGQILDVAFRKRSLKSLKVFPLCSKAVRPAGRGVPQLDLGCGELLLPHELHARDERLPSPHGRRSRPAARPRLVPARPKVCTGYVLYVYEIVGGYCSHMKCTPTVNDCHPSTTRDNHCRVRRGRIKRFYRLLTESQGQNLAVNVLYVPYSLGPWVRGGIAPT